MFCSIIEEDNDSGGFEALDLDGRCPWGLRGHGGTVMHTASLYMAMPLLVRAVQH